MILLNEIQLPYPKKMTRRIIEKGIEHLLVFGKTTKRIENRKEQFILEYQFLTEAQVNSMISLLNLDKVLPFSITEDNLIIAQTNVLMDITNRNYPNSGENWRQNLTVILSEVI